MQISLARFNIIRVSFSLTRQPRTTKKNKKTTAIVVTRTSHKSDKMLKYRNNPKRTFCRHQLIFIFSSKNIIIWIFFFLRFTTSFVESHCAAGIGCYSFFSFLLNKIFLFNSWKQKPIQPPRQQDTLFIYFFFVERLHLKKNLSSICMCKHGLVVYNPFCGCCYTTRVILNDSTR